MGSNPAQEPFPRLAGFSFFQQKVGTVLVGRLVFVARPVVVRHHVFDRDFVGEREPGGQFRRSVDGFGQVVALVLGHFDADGRFVAGTVEIGVLTRFVNRQVLDGDVFLHGVVPEKVAGAPAAAKFAALQRQGMVVRVAGGILRAVDGDVARFQLSRFFAPVAAFWDQVRRYFGLFQQVIRGQRRFGNGAQGCFPRFDASVFFGRRRIGRQVRDEEQNDGGDQGG